MQSLMIDWQSADATKSPLTKHTSKGGLENMILNNPGNFDIFKLFYHTQAVERSIKLVTEASFSVCGKEARDGAMTLLFKV